MNRLVGTVVRGLRGPIINQGDDVATIVTETLLAADKNGDLSIRDRDVLGITESVVARSQGNYVTVDQIAAYVNKKFPGDTLGIVFPILSRNRFSICLRAFARAKKKLVLLLSYPTDEVGNYLIAEDTLVKAGVNIYTTTMEEAEFRKKYGDPKHPFTGVDYVQFYKDLCAEENCACEVVLSNQPASILQYTDEVLTCDIHNRVRTRDLVRAAGAKVVYGMFEIMAEPINGSGYNSAYGLLGSNKSTEEKVKLFPRDCQGMVEQVQKNILAATGKHIEVMVYGDGAFKDPVGKIWELADPVVSPAYTKGLNGTPHELKLKYLADNDFGGMSAEAQKEAIVAKIKSKTNEETAGMAGQGTTPRRLTDLLGSLFDLTSGSGDKGTPFVYVQGYFDTYAND